MVEMTRNEIKMEIARKLIHFLGILFIPFYLEFGKKISFFAILSLTTLAIFIEVLRKRYEIFPKWLLREYESEGIGAYLYFGLAFLVVLAFSTQAVVLSAITAFGGDGVSGIAKKISNRIAFILMFTVSFLLALFISYYINNSYINFNILSLLFSILTASLVEWKMNRIGRWYLNDNFTVPVITAISYDLSEFLIHYNIFYNVF